MTEVPKKRGRKSNAEKAAILAAQEQARAGEQAKDDCEHLQASNCGSENRPTGALPDHETQGVGDDQANDIVRVVIPSIGGLNPNPVSGDDEVPYIHELPIPPIAGGRTSEEHRPKHLLADHETQGLIAEALWAYDMQDESVRFDSRNRKWTFRPDSRDNRASLAIICKRGPDERELLISNVRFGADSVRDEVVAMIELLDGELS